MLKTKKLMVILCIKVQRSLQQSVPLGLSDAPSHNTAVLCSKAGLPQAHLGEAWKIGSWPAFLLPPPPPPVTPPPFLFIHRAT